MRSDPTPRPSFCYDPTVAPYRDGEVVHWRDYLDPVAVFDAIGWPPR